MRASNKNDAKSISKLALVASAAATAAFVISQTRLMQRLVETPKLQAVSFKQQASSAELRASSAEQEAAPAPSGHEAGHEGPETSKRQQAAGDNQEPALSAARAGTGRVRFRGSRPARERLHYGLPVRHRRSGRGTQGIERLEERPLVTVLTPTAPSVPVFDGDDFDPEYLALVEAIACDGAAREDDAEDAEVELEPVAAAAANAVEEAAEELWWLPAPRLKYILIALVYVAASAVAGSDPVTLAADGVGALTTIDSGAGLLVLGWALCGFALVLPLGAMLGRIFSFVTLGKLRRPGFVSEDSALSAAWSLRLMVTAAFIAGAILYSPHALRWAFNTDYPLAAVSSSSMSPALHEGELVLIDGVESIDDLELGDIVAFSHEQGIAVRRVSGFAADGILTTADSTPGEDFVIQFEDVTGRVLTLAGAQVKLPLLGNISLFGERTVEPRASLTGIP